MKKSHLIFFTILLCTQLSVSWDTTFKFNSCYQKRVEERMPLSIDNLIAIVERYERNEANTSPDDLSNAILYRYRKNGVVFNPESKVEWSIYQNEEATKQSLDDKLLKLSVTFPEDTFMPREECSLQMMVSHSTDVYPHKGVDYTWENNYRRRRRALSYSSYSSSSKDKSGTYNSFPDTMELAEHPTESGVIQTRAGPVATGLLLAGIMSMDSTGSYTVSDLVGSENAKEYMSSEMMSKPVNPLYGSTISGELGQAALLTGKSAKRNTFEVGPIGVFGNCSACARIFSLENIKYSHLSRAEIYGALDGLIIAKFLNEQSSSQSLSLSEILRMYYGNHGLFKQDIRACKRKDIFNKFQSQFKNEIKEQALNYMYAYQDYFPEIKSLVAQYQDDFQEIQTTFIQYLDPVLSEFDSFMSSNLYDDPGYEKCPEIMPEDVQGETQVDLVIIFSPTGSSEEVEKQANYIALTARYLGVGYHRSRVAVYNGKTEKWLSPMTNYSNIADYACNYTTFIDFSQSSSQDFGKVMQELTEYYYIFYEAIRSDPDRTGKNSQVVLWNLPSSFDGDEEEMINEWNTFNMTYPDVTFIFAGTKESQLSLFYNNENENEDDLVFINTSPSEPEKIAADLVEVILKAPRMFVYTACDTLQDEYANYNEGSHVYTTYVSPNFTTYIKIPPHYFHFSEYLKLMFKGSDVKICVSRVNKEPSEDDDDSETQCDALEWEEWTPCGRYLEQCDPIYISVSGKPDANNFCTDDACQFPNQLEFQMTHEGMICGVWGLLPAPMLLLTLLLITFSSS